MGKLIQEFKEFAVKGNMVDIAIGVIIGASFNKVIDVLVKKVLMPPLSILTGGNEFQHLKYVLKPEHIGPDGSLLREELAIHYGLLFGVVVDFLIIALTVFIVVKLMNRLKEKAQDVLDESIKTPKDIELLDKLTRLLEEQNSLLAKRNDKAES